MLIDDEWKVTLRLLDFYDDLEYVCVPTLMLQHRRHCI